MKIEEISVKNLRCISESHMNVAPYTCLVGANGAGKSTILCALNIFFRNVESAPTNLATLSQQDFYLQDTSKPIEITVTFGDLSEEAKADFAAYVRQGKLIVTARAVFNESSRVAEVKQYGSRLGMDAHKEFFKQYGDRASAADLLKIYDGLLKANSDLGHHVAKKTKDGIYEGLKAYEAANPNLCVPIESEDQFYGISKGTNRLAKYVQWIYIPAVKDASEEDSERKNGALGKLLARTVRAKVNFSAELEKISAAARIEYEKLLSDNQGALDGVSNALQTRLGEWAHPEATLRILWEQDATKAVKIDPPIAGVLVGESGFEGKLARLGHGFQRSFLLALLQELALTTDTSAPTLILGCEEPELYQHPPQARHLASVFEKLSESGSQIIVTTHSPHFVSGENFESVRMVRRDRGAKSSSVQQYKFSELTSRFAEVTEEQIKKPSATSAKLQQALQPGLNEMFFTERLVLVEGLEDIAYINSWFLAKGQWEAYRKAAVHIVAVNGKSEMIRPAIITRGMQIPTLCIIDSDGDKIGKPDHRTRHHRDNLAMIRLSGADESNLFPSTTLWLKDLVVWPSDLADNFAREVKSSFSNQGAEQYEVAKGKAEQACGQAGDLQKNAVFIGHLVSILESMGAQSPSMDRLCQEILTFGIAAEPAVPAELAELAEPAVPIEPKSGGLFV